MLFGDRAGLVALEPPDGPSPSGDREPEGSGCRLEAADDRAGEASAKCRGGAAGSSRIETDSVHPQRAGFDSQAPCSLRCRPCEDDGRVCPDDLQLGARRDEAGAGSAGEVGFPARRWEASVASAFRRRPGRRMAPSPLGSLPSKPSSSWLSSFTCRSFGGVVAQRCQKRALDSAVTSIDRFWVLSRMSQ